MRRAALTIIRVATGLVFVALGVEKLARHAAAMRDFQHWGLPAAGASAWISGGLEVGCGCLVALGLATRLGALLLMVDSIAIAASAGRVDGAAKLAVPAVLAVACLILTARGGGAFQLLDRIDPPAPRRGLT